MIRIDDVLANNIKKQRISREAVIAIYGTGEGAKEVYRAFENLNMSEQFCFALDRAEAGQTGKYVQGRPVLLLEDIIGKADVIVVAARINHESIEQRIRNFCVQNNVNIRIVNPYLHVNTKEDEILYVHYLEEAYSQQGKEFVPFKEGGYIRENTDTKIIAWYLPQFHQIEINNKFHGQGFTEWTNSSKAFPQFCGHYQPHIPYDVGYYDLLNPDTLRRQVYLAHQYGVYGFAFHYYWFSGKRIMEKPLQLFLEHKEIDMPFCINWANENWTSAWDGGNQNIMYEQSLKPGDEKGFMAELLPLLKDPRYIQIEGRPIISIYRADIFEKEKLVSFISKIRKQAKEEGFPDLFILITTATRGEDEPAAFGADGLVEFPPHRINQYVQRIQPEGYLNPYFKGNIYDMTEYIETGKYMMEYSGGEVFRTAMTGFDNTARRGRTQAGIFYGMTPKSYQKWLLDILKESKEIHQPEKDIVFVNGWNEWAEGAHLEPDLKYGYAYLEATRQALLLARQEEKQR